MEVSRVKDEEEGRGKSENNGGRRENEAVCEETEKSRGD